MQYVTAAGIVSMRALCRNIAALAHKAERHGLAVEGGASAKLPVRPIINAFLSRYLPLSCFSSFLSVSAILLVSTQQNNMAEPAGLVVSVVALASLFNNTVECFEFV